MLKFLKSNLKILDLQYMILFIEKFPQKCCLPQEILKMADLQKQQMIKNL